jgi:hypothetical protein
MNIEKIYFDIETKLKNKPLKFYLFLVVLIGISCLA